RSRLDALTRVNQRAGRRVYPSGMAAATASNHPGAGLPHARRAFRERLARTPLLLDGAMGTLLWSRGLPQLASLFELIETSPDLIGSIHREYIQAGADIIETNTFGANRL